MKILSVHNRYVYEGGEERAVFNLGELLRSSGHEVSYHEHSSHEWLVHGWAQRTCDALSTIYSITAAKEITQNIRDIKPDIVHVHNVFPVLSPSIYYAIKNCNIPIVQTVHNYRFLCVNGLFLNPNNEICERCKKGSFWNAVRWGCYGNSRLQTLPMAVSLALHRRLKTFQHLIDIFIAPSQFSRNKLIESGFSSDKIKVIPNISPIETQFTGNRSDDPFFVYVGRLSREKGLWTLVQAFQSSELGVLKILGDGPLAESLRNHIQSNGLHHIELLGPVTHETVLKWLSRAWCLILPSECYENLPQVVLESWGCGTPVIVSRLGGLAELISDDRKGWTFRPGDSAHLRQTIESILRNPTSLRKTWADCKNSAQKHFEFNTIYSKLISAYESAIQHHPISSS